MRLGQAELQPGQTGHVHRTGPFNNYECPSTRLPTRQNDTMTLTGRKLSSR